MTAPVSGSAVSSGVGGRTAWRKLLKRAVRALVSSAVGAGRGVPVPVSYTHLTLPTN